MCEQRASSDWSGLGVGNWAGGLYAIEQCATCRAYRAIELDPNNIDVVDPDELVPSTGSPTPASPSPSTSPSTSAPTEYPPAPREYSPDDGASTPTGETSPQTGNDDDRDGDDDADGDAWLIS